MVCNSLGTSGRAQDQRPTARGQRPRSGPAAARDQRPPRTWLAVLHHLVGLIIGALSFPLVLAGVTVGSVLTPIGGSGLPILGLTLRYTDGLAALERSRFAGMAGREVPALARRPPPPLPLAGDPGPGRLHRPRHLGQDLLSAAAAARQRAAVPDRGRLLGRRPGHAPAHGCRSTSGRTPCPPSRTGRPAPGGAAGRPAAPGRPSAAGSRGRRRPPAARCCSPPRRGCPAASPPRTPP